MLSIPRSNHGDGLSNSPPGDSMPAPAELASHPIVPASKMLTRIPACASRHAIDVPIRPPPIIATPAASTDRFSIAPLWSRTREPWELDHLIRLRGPSQQPPPNLK